MSGHKPWSEIRRTSEEEMQDWNEHIQETSLAEEKSRLSRFLDALAEFFNPRDWVPQIPRPHKRNPDAKGYQTLGEALRGFPKKEAPDQRA